jgi:thiamine-monophosphate kinase
VQVHGFVDKGCALLRSGAKEGDLICVSGALGDSRAGLSLLGINDHSVLTHEQCYLLDRFHRPEPRISTGLLLNEFASACIDISDGLLADLNHILNRSQVGAKLNADSIPLSQPLRNIAKTQALDWALSGGEDFELCFTVPASKWPQLQTLLTQHDVQISTVGVICAEQGLQIYRDGCWQEVSASGFNHFKQGS